MRDYLTAIHPKTGEVIDPIPATCPDCDRPTYWDEEDHEYHHALNPSEGCFLILGEDRPNDYAHPYFDPAS